MQVHLVRPNDAERLRRTRLAALADAPDAFTTTLAEARRRPLAAWARQAEGHLGSAPCTTVLLLDALGDPTGVGMAAALAHGDGLELVQVWIAPGRRGAGGLAAMVDALARGAAGPLRAEVAPGNERALRAYRALGFEDRGSVPDGAIVVVRDDRPAAGALNPAGPRRGIVAP